jgi:hypothetical protein
VSLHDAQPDPRRPERLRLEVGRTADRLRTMSLVRLAAPLPEGGSRAVRAFALAQQLADAAAELADWPRRALPALADPAAGDVLAVCGLDLAEEVDRHAGDPAAGQACAAAVEALRTLRRDL